MTGGGGSRKSDLIKAIYQTVVKTYRHAPTDCAVKPCFAKGRTIRKVMGGGGGEGKKSKKKIHARENVKKKNSCKEEGKEKKFVQKEGPTPGPAI